MKIYENVPISSFTTMKIGGPARYVIKIESEEDVPEAYKFANQHKLPTFVVGLGANTIGHDEGFDGVVLINRIPHHIDKLPGKDIFKVSSGTEWDDFVLSVSELGFTGIEALANIPSTVGAAPVQNIGAYGQEAASTIIEVEAFDSAHHQFVTLANHQCDFSYRHSIFNSTEKGRYFITSVSFRLEKGRLMPPFYRSLQAYIDRYHITDFSPLSIYHIVTTIRKSKLPDPIEHPSSGSFFKNIYLDRDSALSAKARKIPVYDSDGLNKVPASWLIEHSGLKGQKLHGFRVWADAPLVLVNEDGADYHALALARQGITGKVYEKFGFNLEQEPEELVMLDRFDSTPVNPFEAREQKPNSPEA
ncbi:UDP-N-acetylmuramate dehydrogenase [Candidatus Saccharibacteria bacterium]|nr:UDP-N-acetylmuramate dehydrogenase [Candidatus Saccharibacteria bacterium]